MRTERGSVCDLHGRPVCQERARPGNGLAVTQCHPPPAQPAGRTSSLVSLEAVLARGGTGLSEAVSARASGLFSWCRKERRHVGGHSRGIWGLGLSPAIHPRAPLPEPARDPREFTFSHSSKDQRAAGFHHPGQRDHPSWD